MAAGSFVIIKQGDTYRLLYSGKNFGTGLTVQGIPYDPSGSAGSALNFTEIGSTGIYYYDWDSTSKAYGTWTFVIDATDSGKSAKAYTRIQVVNGDTLDDTAFEKIDTMLDTIISTLATIDGKVDIIDGNVDDIEGEVKSSTYGLSAIKSVVDAIQSAVSGIQNNTQTTVALPEVLVIPGTGTNTYKIYVNTYNNSGEMEDPDEQDPDNTKDAYVSVAVQNQAGTDRGANLGGLSTSTFESKKWMTRVETGRFSCTYAVADTHAVEELIFTFGYEEGGTQEVSKAVTGADVGGSLNNTYWWFFSETTSFYVWYNVSSGGTDPNPTIPVGGPATKVGIEVAIATNDTANTVGSATRTAISTNGTASTQVVVTGSNADVIVTNNTPYNVKNASDGASATGFTITTPTPGAEGSYRVVDRATAVGSSSSDYTSRFDSIDAALVTANGNIDDIETIVASATFGNAALKTLIDAIQADIDDGTNGLAAIKTAVTSNYNLLTNATYGLSALKTILDTITNYVDGVETDLTDIKGSGFATGTDSLKAISDRVYAGGIAI